MPSNEVTMKIEPNDIVERITKEMLLLVQLKPSKRIPFRIRLAIYIIRLANWVGDFGGVEVKVEPIPEKIVLDEADILYSVDHPSIDWSVDWPSEENGGDIGGE